MSDIISLDEILDVRASEQEKEIDILPYNTNGYGAMTITVPDGYTWSSFLEIKGDKVRAGPGSDSTYDSYVISKEQIKAYPTSWKAEIAYNDAGSNYSITLQATSNTTASLTYAGNNTPSIIIAIANMIGVVKKYATTNLTTVIEVKPETVTSGSFVNGNEITVNQRYVIPASQLPAEMLNDDGTIKDGIQVIAEIVNTSGSGAADWGEAGWIWRGDTDTAYGVKGSLLGNTTMVVQTGNAYLSASSNQTGSPWGNLSVISSAPCRLKVVLSGETYITQVPGGA